MDGDLIQGALQSLLQNRGQAAQQQQVAQQQHLDTMRTPLPQMSPIQSIISDYLTKYAASPGMGWSAMASALGNQPQMERKAMESQLMRQEAADAQEAKYAGEALKEADVFGARLAPKTAMGKQPSPEQLRTVYNGLRNEGAQQAKEIKFADPDERAQWIEDYANRGMQNYLEKWSTQPTGPRGALTGAAPKPEQGGVAAPVVGEGDILSQQAQRNIPLIQQEMQRPENQTPDRKAIFEEELAREQAALKTAQLQTGATAPSLPPSQPAVTAPPAPRQGLVGKPTAPAAPVTGATPPAAPPFKDVREVEQGKSYGKEEGQELFKERKALDTLYSSNSRLMGQLNMLENIYNNPNIPEGELAGQVAAFRSGMKSLGVEVSDKAGLTDLAKAVSTGLALTQRTADGGNLLPGAMSNYEDQLLQKMAPTLNLTSQGRLALIQVMKQMAQSNLRYAEEGTKLAADNKDRLPSSWYQRKERVMLEEMAKMKLMSDKLVKQYGGK